MADTNRIWVIDDANEPELTSLGDPLQEAPRPAVPTAPRRPARPVVRPAPPVRRPAAPAASTPRALHHAMRPAAAWALGPLGAAFLAGRRRRLGRALAAGWLAVALATAAGWPAVRAGQAPPAAAPWLLLGLAVTAVAGGTLAAWSLATHLRRAFGDGALGRAWPLPAVLAAGLALPGLAFVLLRKRGRAVATAAMAWPLAAAVALAAAAGPVWRSREAFAGWGLDTAGLEHVLVAAVGLMVLIPLLAAAQGLEALRLSAADGPARSRGGGDRAALALLMVFVAAMVLGNPRRAAEELGARAEALAAAGCIESPLLLLRAAERLDPARPAYALAAADLLEAKGQADAADRVRRGLEADLAPYVGALVRAVPPAPPPAASPAPAPAPVPAAAPATPPAAAASPGPEILLLPGLPLRGAAGPPAPAAGP